MKTVKEQLSELRPFRIGRDGGQQPSHLILSADETFIHRQGAVFPAAPLFLARLPVSSLLFLHCLTPIYGLLGLFRALNPTYVHVFPIVRNCFGSGARFRLKVDGSVVSPHLYVFTTCQTPSFTS